VKWGRAGGQPRRKATTRIVGVVGGVIGVGDVVVVVAVQFLSDHL
jgi:hypothetical protein